MYIGFEGRDGRHRLSYQVGRPEDHAAAAEELDKMGYDPCRRDFAGWECFAVYEGTVIQGEAACLKRRCEVTQREAEALLGMGRDHLASLVQAR